MGRPRGAAIARGHYLVRNFPGEPLLLILGVPRRPWYELKRRRGLPRCTLSDRRQRRLGAGEARLKVTRVLQLCTREGTTHCCRRNRAHVWLLGVGTCWLGPCAVMGAAGGDGAAHRGWRRGLNEGARWEGSWRRLQGGEPTFVLGPAALFSRFLSVMDDYVADLKSSWH